VRVPGHEPGYMCRMADLVPSAIMVPFINNAEQARTIAKALCFPPTGVRSYGGVRAMTHFGADYCEKKHTLLIAQIETEEAVKNAAGIINTPGIDMLFFSGNDMRMDMGIPFDTNVDQNPVLASCMQSVAKACLDCGKLAGIVATSDIMLQMVVEAGYTSIVSAGDSFFLMKSQPYSNEIRRKTTELFDNKGGK